MDKKECESLIKNYLENRLDICLYQLEKLEKQEIEKGLTSYELNRLKKLYFEISILKEKLGVQYV
jgi:hypothetical protein